ncbi:uncharacterized protein MELLADRAFT_72941 [Melampsora larici-populina 98AG31]|uniref:F-box domain-containing protein n=1 Tax=Melampsora larici-populina (strain 98AG31 / pathotype 3-4-7) TaxID=747676 RepID=F4S141_MELLP|nr:uncharacterized protein MELLADRAFT_72941 [Melampsora larici-populina 98AG31]EGG01702.1 hypothetical protein MELLADRAFT_72941 [Melampsora larici-populina 98AG31]
MISLQDTNPIQQSHQTFTMNELPIDILTIILKWCHTFDQAEVSKSNFNRNQVHHPSHSIHLKNRIYSLGSVNWIFHQFCQSHVGEYLETSRSSKQLEFIRDQWLPKYSDQVKQIAITGPKTLNSLESTTLILDLLYEICGSLQNRRIEVIEIDHHFFDASHFESNKTSDVRWHELLCEMAPQLTQLTINNKPTDEFLPDDINELEIIKHFHTINKLEVFKAHNICKSISSISPLAQLLSTQNNLKSLSISKSTCFNQSWSKVNWLGSLINLSIKSCETVEMCWIKEFILQFSKSLRFLELKINHEERLELTDIEKINLPNLIKLSLIGNIESLISFTTSSNLKTLILGGGRKKIDYESLGDLIESNWDQLNRLILFDNPGSISQKHFIKVCESRGINVKFSGISASYHCY